LPKELKRAADAQKEIDNLAQDQLRTQKEIRDDIRDNNKLLADNLKLGQ